MIEIKVLKTIDEIKKDSIDSISDHGFFTYAWFKTLETSKTFKIVPQYLVVYEGNMIVAIAPCFIEYTAQYFTLQDLIFPPIKRILGAFTRLGSVFTPPLACHSPCSFHTQVLHQNSSCERASLKLITKEMDAICQKKKILFSSFPFVSENDALLMENLSSEGYLKFPFMRELSLDVKWNTFEDYLASLEYKVRKNIRREMRKFSEHGIVLEETNDFRSVASTISDLYSNLFLRHMGRKSLLDTRFFEKLSEYAKDEAKVFLAKKNGEIIGFLLSLEHGDVLDCYIAGFDYDSLSKTDFAYFNVVYYAPIKAAIEEGFRKIHFRTTEPTIKLRRGCKLEGIYAFVKCHNALLNPFFKEYVKRRYQNRGFPRG